MSRRPFAVLSEAVHRVSRRRQASKAGPDAGPDAGLESGPEAGTGTGLGTGLDVWVWSCGQCPDLRPWPCGSQDEAAFLGRQHDLLHHGVPLAAPAGHAVPQQAPSRALPFPLAVSPSVPAFGAGLRSEAGFTATTPGGDL
jgi:hypothetical protein